MTQLVFNRDEELILWAEKVCPDCAPISRPSTTIGIASSSGEIMGVAIYMNFIHYDVQICFVTDDPSWATPGNVRAILHYPFIQLGVKRMTAITNKSNKKARKLLEGVGFALEGTHPYGDNGVKTSLTYGLYSNKAARWLNG